MKPMDMRKTRHEISEDELLARMEFKEKASDYPRRAAVALLEVGLNKVLREFGIDVETDIPLQCEVLGIVVTDAPEGTPEGFHVLRRFVRTSDMKVDYVPIAWIGGAGVSHLGHVVASIQWFQKNIEEELVGPKMPEVEKC